MNHQPGQRTRPLFIPLILAILLVIGGMYIAVHMAIVAKRFLPVLNVTSPALARLEPLLAEAPPPQQARRVIIVVIDGLRLGESYGLPFLDSLRQRGVDASATSHYPSISRPNYVTVATGVPPLASGVRTNDYNTEVRLDSLMDRTRAAGMRSAYVGDVSNGLPTMFARIETDDAGDPRYENALDSANFATWPGGIERTIEGLIAGPYELTIIVPGAVDKAGHRHGGASERYRSASRHVDRMLERALGGLDLARDALIVIADHGHSDRGGHGGTEPEVMEVPLILAGAGIRPGAAVDGARLVDIAPTAAALLGLPAPGHGLGRTLTEALTLSPPARDAVSAADQRRVLRNQAVVESWHEDAARDQRARAMWRAPLCALLLGLTVLTIIAAHRLGALHVDWRVLVIALPTFPLTYYALIATLGQTFSPSFIPELGSLVDRLFAVGLISTLVYIVASWFAFRGRVVLCERLATASGLFLCGLVSSLVPVAAVWALMPAPFVTVPGPKLLVLVPATYVACTCYAIAVVAMLTLEIVIFFARAVDPRVMRILHRAR